MTMATQNRIHLNRRCNACDHAYPWAEVRQTSARLKWTGCDCGNVCCIVADCQQLLRGAYAAKERAALRHQAPLSPPLPRSVKGPQ